MPDRDNPEMGDRGIPEWFVRDVFSYNEGRFHSVEEQQEDGATWAKDFSDFGFARFLALYPGDHEERYRQFVQHEDEWRRPQVERLAGAELQELTQEAGLGTIAKYRRYQLARVLYQERCDGPVCTELKHQQERRGDA